MTKSAQQVTAGVLFVVVASGTFWGGMKYQAHKDASGSTVAQATTRADFQGIPGGGAPGGPQRFAGRRGAGGGLTVGDITSVDGSTITIQGFNGSPSTINLSGSTTVSKQATGSTSDLSVGESITVTGSAASDGSIDAQTIQIRPSTPGGADTGAGAL